MSTYLLTLWRFWVASISAEAEYRANFVLSAISSLLAGGGALFTLYALMHTGYDLGGWSWAGGLLVIGAYTLIDGVQQVALAPNRGQLTEMVREGNLDFVLLKPIDPQFWLSARRVSLWGLPNMALGVIMIAVGLGNLDVAPTVGGVTTMAVLLGAAVVTLYAMGFMLATLCIWLVKMDNLTYTMTALMEAGRYPIQAYPTAYRVFFTAVIPVAFMTTVPAQAAIGEGSPAWIVGAFALATVTFLFSRWFFRFALRHYTSASS